MTAIKKKKSNIENQFKLDTVVAEQEPIPPSKITLSH